MRRYLAAAGAWTDADEDALRAGVDAECKAAVAAAERAAPPELAPMFRDVYGTVPWHLAEQLAEAEAAAVGLQKGA